MDKETLPDILTAADSRPAPELEYSSQILWDPNEYSAMVCRSCGIPRVFRRRRINHSRHLLFTLGTLGLWLPGWGIVILLQPLKAWRCIVCGAHQLHN